MTTPISPQQASANRNGAVDAPATGRPVHVRSRGRHRFARVVALTLTGSIAFGGTAAGAFYYKIQHNIEGIDLSNLVNEEDRPAAPSPDPDDPNKDSPVNILIVGSDDRSGENATIGGAVEGMRSDTAIVMHISADRSRVEMVSIPRDSLVNLPACETTKGTVPARRNSMFNEAFANGWDKGGDVTSAMNCTMRAVETLTDIWLDGFIMVDFVGFEAMVEAIGGVPIDIPEEINSPMANLHLDAGPQTLNGQQALGLARARKGKGLGDGSDIQRIDRQQDLLNAMAATLLDKNLLTDTPALMKFLDAATSSLTASANFASLKNLTGLALSLKNVSTDSITFLTVPWAAAPTDKNRVVWTSEATKIWQRMKADEPINGSPTPTPDPNATDAATEMPTDPTSATATGVTVH